MTARPLGMENGYNSAAWPPLENGEVATLLPCWGVEAARSPILWHSRRPFSAAGIIALEDGGRLFLKRHGQALRRVETLEEEHRFARHLAGQGLPVSAPLPMTDGRTALARSGYAYEAFPLFAEQDAYRGLDSWRPYHDVAQAASAGTLLARLHQAGAGYSAPARDNPPLISARAPLAGHRLEESLLPWADRQAGLATLYPPARMEAEALPLLTPFHEALRPFLTDDSPLWGHGDFHGANLLWQGKNNAAHLTAARVFDFGMCDRTSAAFDLAVAIERSFIGWLDPTGRPGVHGAQLRAFLHAYDAQRPRNRVERILTARWLPLCHASFALSEIAYYGHILGNPAGTEIARRDYLLGHARWFHTGSGQALLRELETA